MRKSSLWAGPDHLLLVRGTRYFEEYRRFYYRDIQCLLLQPCKRTGSVGWWVLLVGALGLLGLLQTATRFLPVVLVPATVLLLLVLLVRLGLALFYSCRCYVGTAVSWEELPSLHRRGSARQALAEVRTRVGEAQGSLPDGLGSLWDQLPAASDPARQATEEPASSEANADWAVKISLLVFVLILADALQTYRFLDGPIEGMKTVPGRILPMLLLVATGAATMFALFKAHHGRNLRSLRALLIAAVMLEGVDLYVSNILATLYQLRNGVITMTMPATRVWHWLLSTDEFLLTAFGFGGLIFVVLNWNSLRRPAVSQP